MRRTLRNGDTYKAFVEKNESIEQAVRTAVKALKPFGACNVQLRIRNGEPYIFEFNARCSGTTGARALVGFNEPRMIADAILKGIPPTADISEATVLRYWKEMVVSNDRIDTLRNAGSISTIVDRL